LLAPVGDSAYRSLRPKLALDDSEGTPFAEDGRLHWHPSVDAISKLHAEGKVTVMPAIGYDHPDQSHFNSRHFWEVGALDRRRVAGRTADLRPRLQPFGGQSTTGFVSYRTGDAAGRFSS